MKITSIVNSKESICVFSLKGTIGAKNIIYAMRLGTIMQIRKKTAPMKYPSWTLMEMKCLCSFTSPGNLKQKVELRENSSFIALGTS